MLVTVIIKLFVDLWMAFLFLAFLNGPVYRDLIRYLKCVGDVYFIDIFRYFIDTLSIELYFWFHLTFVKAQKVI